MVMQTPERHWSQSGLKRLATAFVAQEHVGILGGLLLRLARFLGGDPTQQISVVVAFNTSTGLPDNTPAHSAVFQVTAAPIAWRVDGGVATVADIQAPVGTIIVLTGQPTIKGFRAVGTQLQAATLFGSYYD